MKTYSTTSFSQLEGYLGGFASPVTLRVVRGYRSSTPTGLRCPPGGASTGYRSSPAVASDGEPGYNQVVRCLVLFSLLLVARVVAGLPPVAASNPAPKAPEGYFADQTLDQPPATTTASWEILTAPPGSPAAFGPTYAGTRAGPAPPMPSSHSF